MKPGNASGMRTVQIPATPRSAAAADPIPSAIASHAKRMTRASPPLISSSPVNPPTRDELRSFPSRSRFGHSVFYEERQLDRIDVAQAAQLASMVAEERSGQYHNVEPKRLFI